MSQKYAHVDEKTRKVLGFYMDGLHRPDQIPEGAVAINDLDHAALLGGQSLGLHMHVEPDGTPRLENPPPPSDDEMASAIRAARAAILRDTDAMVARHRDEREFEDRTTLTQEQFVTLGQYRKALRDLPTTEGWPRIELPQPPDFI